MPAGKLLFTIREAAANLGVSEGTIVTLTRSGQLHHVKIGRSVRIPSDKLADFAQVGTPGKTTSGKPLHQMWQPSPQVG